MRTPEGSRVQQSTVAAVRAHFGHQRRQGNFFALRKTDERCSEFFRGRPATQDIAATILRHRGFESGGDSRVSPSPLGTLHHHPEGKKSRLRAFSLAPLF